MTNPILPENIQRDLRQIQAEENIDEKSILVRLLTKAIQDWKLEHNAQAYAAV